MATTPVHDFDAEWQLLGAIMFDDKNMSAVPARLTPASFFAQGSHGHIFAAMLELREERAGINLSNVWEKLRSNGRISQIEGGAAYLVRIANEAPVQTAKSFERLAAVIVNKATQRQLQLVLKQALARASDPTADVQTELEAIEKSVLDLSLNVHDTHGGLVQISDALRREIAEWNRRATTSDPPGIPTGYLSLDREIGGLHGGELIVLGARPGMGKTSLVTGLAVNVAKRDMATAIFSLEMPRGQLAGRMLCSESGLRLNRVRVGRFEGNDLTKAQMALHTLRDLGVYIDDAAKGRPYVADIISRSRRLAAALERKGKKLALVVVDYIQIVKLREELQKQRHDLAIGEVSLELKALSKELGCTVVACAQLNRSVESRNDKRPGMADLRDSGQIEQDADQILMLYRDEYYNPKTAWPGVVEVIIEKNRHGKTGTIRLRFDGPTTTFHDAPDLDVEDAAQ
jgi:replicative DNA helicase